MIVEYKVLFVEQSADQCRLAVDDRAAGEEPQAGPSIDASGASRRLGGECSGAVHQKYPSRFFFSIEPDSSRSMTRPCRSELDDSRISSMIASSVSAFEVTAPVSG